MTKKYSKLTSRQTDLKSFFCVGKSEPAIVTGGGNSIFLLPKKKEKFPEFTTVIDGWSKGERKREQTGKKRQREDSRGMIKERADGGHAEDGSQKKMDGVEGGRRIGEKG